MRQSASVPASWRRTQTANLAKDDRLPALTAADLTMQSLNVSWDASSPVASRRFVVQMCSAFPVRKVITRVKVLRMVYLDKGQPFSLLPCAEVNASMRCRHPLKPMFISQKQASSTGELEFPA